MDVVFEMAGRRGVRRLLSRRWRRSDGWWCAGSPLSSPTRCSAGRCCATPARWWASTSSTVWSGRACSSDALSELFARVGSDPARPAARGGGRTHLPAGRGGPGAHRSARAAHHRQATARPYGLRRSAPEPRAAPCSRAAPASAPPGSRGNSGERRATPHAAPADAARCLRRGSGAGIPSRERATRKLPSTMAKTFAELGLTERTLEGAARRRLRGAEPDPGAGDPVAAGGARRDRPSADGNRQDGGVRAADHGVRRSRGARGAGAGADPHARAVHSGDAGAARRTAPTRASTWWRSSAARRSAPSRRSCARGGTWWWGPWAGCST